MILKSKVPDPRKGELQTEGRVNNSKDGKYGRSVKNLDDKISLNISMIPK